MSLASGARLGPYEILAALGAGGMGEVYRARDPRLEREVAIKVLPTSFSSDPERLRRFEQEARATAALNHTNILTVHEIGSHDGSPFIVSELLDGRTLRDVLADGALPVRKAVECAIQICRGLAAAHAKGIVHRDLKPENIFVSSTGQVKILDFGLAKLTEGVAPVAASALPTAPPNTVPGMVLGTVGDMAPEQVRGLAADHRADIFALGAILHEALSGQRAFRGDTTMDVMMAIVREDPPELPAVARQIPPALVRIVGRCLDKSPAARFQSADDLAFAMDALSAHSGPTPAVAVAPRWPRERLLWGAATSVLLVAALGLSAFLVRSEPTASRALTLSVTLPGGPVISENAPAISPDGASLAFVARNAAGRRTLWVRPLSASAAREIPGTDAAADPFWSPDGRSLGFFADRKLKTIDLVGGPAVARCDAAGFGKATWSSRGVILFASAGRLQRLQLEDGRCAALANFETQGEQGPLLYPQFLPDGQHFLHMDLDGGIASPDGAIYVASLDATERKLLFRASSHVSYAGGHLFFRRGQTTVLAQRFDASRRELTGEAIPVADQVQGSIRPPRATFAVSEHLLAYRAGVGSVVSDLVWFDRSGRPLGTVGAPSRAYRDLELSPDGRWAALSQAEGEPGRDLWLYEVGRGVPTRFTSSEADDQALIWSPDGRRVAFASRRKEHVDLYLQNANATGPEEMLFADDSDKWPISWSRNGRFILYSRGTGSPTRDLWIVPLDGDRKPFPFLETRFDEDFGQFSPDGRWVAYQSDESGQAEIYIAPFQRSADRIRVSTAGGRWPRWRADGTELFFLAADDVLMVAPVKTSASAIASGTLQPLFDARPTLLQSRYPYAVAPDGERILVNRAPDELAEPITVIVNWPALESLRAARR